MSAETNQFIQVIREQLQSETFVKLSLVAYHGEEENLKKILIRKVRIKRVDKLSFTYRYTTKDTVKNYAVEEALQRIAQFMGMGGFRLANLYTIDFDMSLELLKNGKTRLKKRPPSIREVPSPEHDKRKHRKIEATGKPYLHELKITDQEGKVYKSTQDKFKQINHYVEILSSLLHKLPNREMTKVVDMGAGKGYLTFALYDYLNNVLKKPASVIGVEYRKDLVDLCNTIAQKASFDDLKFVQGAIENYKNEDIDVLIALHACDTATDDAIAKGIKNDADLIVVAPCCHKQIRREMERYKASNELDFLTKHGVFLERQAEMVTDGIRALILEYYGYSTKVMEFVSDAHTPKNVLIIGSKNNQHGDHKAAILAKINATKAYFGIAYHHLERNMSLQLG